MMPSELAATPAVSAAASAEDRAGLVRRLKLLGAVAAGLAVAFCLPIFDLIRLAFESQLYSYILLVPFVSLYLAWIKKDRLPPGFRAGRAPAVALAGAGAAVLFAYWAALHSGWKPVPQDRLAVLMLSFVFLFWSACVRVLGSSKCWSLVFPIAFLIFLSPLPKAAETWLEWFLQHTSATTAYWMIAGVGTPVLHSGTMFQLPDISIEVAPQCSGIHSSLVLFITGLVGGYLLLRKGWTRTLLALFVIPLGILRNGFRVFTLAELCVHVNPDIINSPLHHKGGPIFFVISLIPFFLFVWLLMKLDRRGARSSPAAPISDGPPSTGAAPKQD